MIVKIYKNPQTDTLFIDGVTAGNVSEFRMDRGGDVFSLWHNGFELYEVASVNYTEFRDEFDQSFDAADDLANYLIQALQIDAPNETDFVLIFENSLETGVMQ